MQIQIKWWQIAIIIIIIIIRLCQVKELCIYTVSQKNVPLCNGPYF